MLKSISLLGLALNVFESNGKLIYPTQALYSHAVLTLSFSPAFRITYPQKGDLVNVYNGLPTTWSYNSSDSIFLPLLIQFVAASHQEEAPDYTTDELNITLGTYTIQTTFDVADYYLLRFIYGNNAYETRGFDITTSEKPKNASDTLSATSSLVESTASPSVLVHSATESATGTSSLMPSGSGAAAATTEFPKTDEKNDDGLSTGAKVGIGIGCSAAAIIGMLGLLVLYRIKKKNKTIPKPPPRPPSVGQIETELDGSSAARRIFEMDGKQGAANISELPSHPVPSSELPG
ncbi:unnamed protein product [Penicillium salamii]|uniref:Mid2 domain-containing protein n=1 Tax=Penicillium salamii TaxID=1612424 RepID=A0A9W4IXF8_9EURO|nr:unnamed protein product [Penicillium salamii]